MENSLASIFMEASPPCLPLSWDCSSTSSSGESIEELQQQLAHTSMELESAQQAATLQTNLNRALLGRLQGLLDSARKERDDARNKCEKLQNCIFRLSGSPQQRLGDENNSSFQSLAISSLPPRQCQEVPVHNLEGLMSGCPKPTASTGDEVMSILEEFATDGLLLERDSRDMFPTLGCCSMEEDSRGDPHQQFGMDTFTGGAIRVDEDQSLHDEITKRSTLQQQREQTPLWEARIQCQGPGHCPTQCQSERRPNPNSCTWVDMKNVSTLPLPKSACISTQFGGSMNLCKQAPVMMPALQVGQLDSKASGIIGPLPEKGKLLQAVMDAGPLLQTLIVAGRLPEWSRPPPLHVLNIVKAPLSPSSVLWSPFAGDCVQPIQPRPQLHPQPSQLPQLHPQLHPQPLQLHPPSPQLHPKPHLKVLSPVVPDALAIASPSLGLRRCKSANLQGKFDSQGIKFLGNSNGMHNSSSASSSTGPRRKLYKLLPQTS